MRDAGRMCRHAGMATLAVALLAGCWGPKPEPPKAGEPLTLVAGMAKVEKVTPELLYAIVKTEAGRQTVYWDERTFFFRNGEPLKGEAKIQPGDRFEYRGMEAHNEIYLTRVNFSK